MYAISYTIAMKNVFWIADSLEVLSNFPSQAKHDLGVELMRVQAGLDPLNYRPMPSIGPGVSENLNLQGLGISNS